MTQYELASKQSDLLEAIYLACQDGEGGDIVNRLNAEYDDTVIDLLKMLGEDGPAAQIDIDQYSFFSDLFKDECGFRPQGYSYSYMVEWMDKRKPS